MRHQQVPIGGKLPIDRNAAAGVVDRVEVVFDLSVVVVEAVVGLLGRRQLVAVAVVGQVVRAKIGRATGEGRKLVIDVAAAVILIDNRTDGELVLDDRKVDHRIERTVCCPASGTTEAAFDPGFELA